MYEPVGKRFEEVMITFMLPEASRRVVAPLLGATTALVLMVPCRATSAPETTNIKNASAKQSAPADKQSLPQHIQEKSAHKDGPKESASTARPPESCEVAKSGTSSKRGASKAPLTAPVVEAGRQAGRSTEQSSEARTEWSRQSGKAETTRHAGAKRRVAVERLVPPPPPSIPGVLATPHMVPGFEVIEFVSHDELVELCERTTAERERANKKLTLTKSQSDEKKKRAQSFQTLYSEGVVSRRELESAQHETATLEDEVTEQEQRVADLDIKLNRINAKLKTFPSSTRKRKTETAKKVDELTK